MLGWALTLFIIAALGGVTMAIIHFRGTNPPTIFALAHGALAATALLLLLIAVLGGEAPGLATWALIVFLVAALGGAFLFVFQHLRQTRLSSPVVLIHGSIAALGAVLLLIAYLGMPGEAPMAETPEPPAAEMSAPEMPAPEMPAPEMPAPETPAAETPAQEMPAQ
jgi:hypothetical protein